MSSYSCFHFLCQVFSLLTVCNHRILAFPFKDSLKSLLFVSSPREETDQSSQVQGDVILHGSITNVLLCVSHFFRYSLFLEQWLKYLKEHNFSCNVRFGHVSKSRPWHHSFICCPPCFLHKLKVCLIWQVSIAENSVFFSCIQYFLNGVGGERG